MYKYLFFILIMASNGFCESKILWWNIGYNEYSLPSTQNPGESNLDDTLKNGNWNKYDVIALGEYIPKTLNKSSLDKIKRLFPFQKVLKYNNAYGKSLYIFSKKRFRYKISKLGWYNPEDNFVEQIAYKKSMEKKYGKMDTFVRKYIRINLKLDNESYNFVFFHLNNPWILFKKHDGILKVGYELLFGKRNPLYNQLLNLKESLKMDLGPHLNTKNVVLMGDSNCPRKAKGLTPVCYDLMEETLPMILDAKKDITFPAKGSKIYGKLPKVKIDHVQASTHIRGRVEVLNHVGSDHKAVELTID